MSTSFDSAHQPLTEHHPMSPQNYLKSEYNSNSPYGDSYYARSAGYIPPQTPRKPVSKWFKFGIPAAILIIAAIAVGVAVGVTRHSSQQSADAAASSASQASASASSQSDLALFVTSYGSQYLNPYYPSVTDSAQFTTPTFNANRLTWPKDTFAPSNPNPTAVRPDRPRLIAPSYKWAALPTLISTDPYMQLWNQSIINNATQYATGPLVTFVNDGAGNGALDSCRHMKEHVKAYAYAYRVTNDTNWANLAYDELVNAAGNATSFGDSTWPALSTFGLNAWHFLDTAEACAAFAIGYDWLYDYWSDDQKTALRYSMLQICLTVGTTAYYNAPNYNGTVGWWSNTIQGNWNCVCNSGLTMGALAILGDDTTGTAELVLSYSIDNALANCIQAVSSDGTWSETANYWYFGTTAHAEMTSSLITATGSDFGLLRNNPNFYLTGRYHEYVYAPTTVFNYGDTGPNKFSTTANSMLFYGSAFDMAEYMLFQRDRFDAPEPNAMFWYDPSAQGAWWADLPLDNFFINSTDHWVAMRSSWTDTNALYTAMKVGTLEGHQTHGDLDAGDFVIDAMGVRWAGELGSGDYDSIGYFTSEAQNAQRWLYYRKRTEGQNTLMVNSDNQNVLAAPTCTFGTSNTTQPADTTVFNITDDSTAYAVADLTSAYFNVTSVQRGLRLINNRRQVLLQDEVQASAPVQWRMHTNATVAIDPSGTSATLSLEGETMIMQVLNMPSGGVLGTANATRLPTDPTPPQADQPNPGVLVVTIDMPAGQFTLEVLFNPQWSGMSQSAFVSPPSVALNSWSLTSHN